MHVRVCVCVCVRACVRNFVSVFDLCVCVPYRDRLPPQTPTGACSRATRGRIHRLRMSRIGGAQWRRGTWPGHNRPGWAGDRLSTRHPTTGPHTHTPQTQRTSVQLLRDSEVETHLALPFAAGRGPGGMERRLRRERWSGEGLWRLSEADRHDFVARRWRLRRRARPYRPWEAFCLLPAFWLSCKVSFGLLLAFWQTFSSLWDNSFFWGLRLDIINKTTFNCIFRKDNPCKELRDDLNTPTPASQQLSLV